MVYGTLFASREKVPPPSKPLFSFQLNPIKRGIFGLRTYWFLIFIILAGFFESASAQGVSGADSTLAAIRTLFDNGSYISAELQARRVLEDKTVTDTERVKLEKYIGFALVAQGKNTSAVEHFINALKIDSSLTLDPVLTSPKILAVFDSAKRQFRSEISADLSKRIPSEPVVVKSGPTFRAILFPGWEQYHQGRKKKGYLLMGVGGIAAASAIASDLLRRDAHTKYLQATTPAMAQSRYTTYNTYYKTEIYSVSAFVLVYIYSEFDSFLDLPPHLDADYSAQTRSLSLTFRLPF